MITLLQPAWYCQNDAKFTSMYYHFWIWTPLKWNYAERNPKSIRTISDPLQKAIIQHSSFSKFLPSTGLTNTLIFFSTQFKRTSVLCWRLVGFTVRFGSRTNTTPLSYMSAYIQQSRANLRSRILCLSIPIFSEHGHDLDTSLPTSKHKYRECPFVSVCSSGYSRKFEDDSCSKGSPRSCKEKPRRCLKSHQSYPNCHLSRTHLTTYIRSKAIFWLPWATN